MKKALIMLMVIMSLAACSDGAQNLYENARFEELQNNHKHALQIYHDIVNKYPETDYAQKARERIDELNKLKSGK